MHSDTASLQPIESIAAIAGIPEQYIRRYGRWLAKVDIAASSLAPTQAHAQIILVSSMTPTPAGEGKTVTTLGLADALRAIGKNTMACIRQPSLGPVFGSKGGAAGGGLSQVVPMEQLNLHCTGDIHAITAAHNLASAALEARSFHEKRLGESFLGVAGQTPLNLDPNRLLWGRVLDQNDRALRRVRLDATADERESEFEITAASELMAILALSDDWADLRRRIGQVRLAYDRQGYPVTAERLEVAGAMAALMKETIHPNLMQTRFQTPVLIHAGPFANIAHGNSSIIADRMAASYAEYVVTEAGFGSDMGMEKYFNIKCRRSEMPPACVVLVCTVRSLKIHSQAARASALSLQAQGGSLSIQRAGLSGGLANLAWHIQNVHRYGAAVVVSINRFEGDDPADLAIIDAYAKEAGADAVAVNAGFLEGPGGGVALAEAVVAASNPEASLKLLYKDTDPVLTKLNTLGCLGYGASEVVLEPAAIEALELLESEGYGQLPLCVAKTPFSISSDPSVLGVPTPFRLTVTHLRVNAGAEFICAYTPGILTMPGLGVKPAYRRIDLLSDGTITGL